MDCYALNAATERDAWCYYYVDFPLVHLRDGQAIESWDCPVAGARGVAVDAGMALLHGEYHAREIFTLLTLEREARMEEQARYTLVNERREALSLDHVALRVDTVVILSGTRLYRTTILELMNQSDQ